MFLLFSSCLSAVLKQNASVGIKIIYNLKILIKAINQDYGNSM